MDEVDQALLAELNADGRVSQQELALRLGISRPAVARRLGRLMSEDGVRVVGVVHPSTQGIEVMGQAAVMVDGPVEGVAQEICADARCVFVSITAGSMSLVADIRTATLSEFEACLERIRRISGVVRTDTMTYSNVILDVLQPCRVEDPKIDEVDLALIALLQMNGRTAYTELARMVGVSPGTARTRVTRLLNERVLRIGVIQERPATDSHLRIGVGVKVRNLGPVVDLTASLEHIHFLTKAIGRFDLVATIDGVTRADAIRTIDDIRAMPGVLDIESWVHLKVMKERY